MSSEKKQTPSWEHVASDGSFERRATAFHDVISNELDARFRAEPHRYHLYVSFACPWAHRTLLVRALKGLSDVISVNVVDWLLPKGGWTLTATSPGATPDTVNGKHTLREVYELAQPDYAGSVTVPVLWDKRERTIVNNESSEIIVFFNDQFNEVATCKDLDLYPRHLRSTIDEVNSWVYPLINNGVYQAGFARKQEAYERAVRGVFEGLDRAEAILQKNRYMTGSELTLADIRLWPTLVRFDAVYHTHFKCNLRRLVDYPALWRYTRELYSLPAFRSTTHFDHIKHHYFESHSSLNPQGIVPLGPLIDYTLPEGHGRAAQELR